jgi:type II secretion system protein N
MAAPSRARFPRWLVAAFYPVAALVLILFFIFVGFPYDRLALRLSQTLESRVNLRVRIGELSPHIGLGGPGISASQVLVKREGSQTVAVEQLVVRPAWSLSWFWGQPAIHLDLRSEEAVGSGTLTLGDTGGWKGILEGVPVGQLPFELLERLDIDGTLDASVDLHLAAAEAGGELAGQVDFDLRNGSLRAEGLPVALPFERLHGRLDFGGDHYISVSTLELQGPLLDGTIQGNLGYADAPGAQPVSIDLAYSVHDESLAEMLSSMGSRRQGDRGQLRVTGTLANPVIR